MLLSIDTSSVNGGFSLYDEDQILVAESYWGSEKSHSETLTFEFEKILTNLKIKTKMINRVLCTSGPGSFTGLRVGLNFSKLICFVNQIELYLSPSFRGYLGN